MARAGRAVRAQSRPDSDRARMAELALCLARQPQIAALEALAAWAERQGVAPASVNGMRAVIAVFAAAPDAPNLDLAMRLRRGQIVREFRETARPG